MRFHIRYHAFLGVLLFILSLAGLHAWEESAPGGFAAKAILSTEKVLLPETVTVELELSHPANYHVDEKKLVDNLLRNSGPGPAPFLLLSGEKKALPEQTHKNASTSEQWFFRLEPQVAGHHLLTFFDIVFLPNDSAKTVPLELTSGVLPIDVALPPAGTEDTFFLPQAAPLAQVNTLPIDLYSITRADLNEKQATQEAIRNVALWKTKRFPWELVVLIAVALLTAIYLKMRPQKTRALKAELQSQLHYQEAEKYLLLLQQQGQQAEPAKHSQIKAFVIELTNAVRAHLEERYQVGILSQTTEEFFASIASIEGLDGKEEALIKKFIALVDPVKFASHTLSLEECLEAKKTAREILSWA